MRHLFLTLIFVLCTINVVLAEEQIVKGKTSQDEILKYFGTPSSTREKDDTIVWIYPRSKARKIAIQQINHIKTDAEAFIVVFDKKKLVLDYYFRLGSGRLWRGVIYLRRD